MNHYINMYQPLINACVTQRDFVTVYNRIASAIAGIIIGRGFNQLYDDYLSANPVKKEFNTWWMNIKDDLHTKAFNKPAV